jgi:hypothetical protein
MGREFAAEADLAWTAEVLRAMLALSPWRHVLRVVVNAMGVACPCGHSIPCADPECGCCECTAH